MTGSDTSSDRSERGRRQTQDRSDELIEGFATITAALTATRYAAASDLDESPSVGAGTGAVARASAEAPEAPAVPTTLLTGFLGSGKTTVVRRLLAGSHGVRVSAIVNDLAAVNVDALALGNRFTGDAGAELDRLQLTNGCACCELTDDLRASLAAAIDAGGEPGRTTPDAIVVEATGAADPVSMAATIDSAPGLALDGIVCVVDADSFPQQLDDAVLGRLARRQIEAAHLVLLSKVDLVDPALAAEVTRSIAGIAPGRQVIPARNGDVDPAVLLAAAKLGAALPTSGSSARADLATRSIRPDPLDLPRLAAWLERPHGLVRAKGWVHDRHGRAHELQVVGRRWTLSPASDSSPSTVVLIATSEDALDRADIELRALSG